MIVALACPSCNAESYRALGAHAEGVRAACALCGTVYVVPSYERLMERANRHRETPDRRWELDEPSYHPPRVAGVVEPAPAASGSLWARCGAAWRGAVRGWRGA